MHQRFEVVKYNSRRQPAPDSYGGTVVCILCSYVIVGGQHNVGLVCIRIM
jgi:hypothetical protein